MDISPHIFITLNTIGGDFSYVEVWFTDQDNNPLEMEDNVNITLIIM